MIKSGLFSSESVSSGHPDKIADQVSDIILDEFLSQDKYTRCGIESFITRDQIIVSGEVSNLHDYDVNLEIKIRELLEDIGYNNPNSSFSANKVKILNHLHTQSSDIVQGVLHENNSIGAGDQGLMFGYASDENDVFMPTPIMLSHRLLKSLESSRKNGNLKGFGPDMKTQFTLNYEDGIPVSINSIVLSAQHDPEMSQDIIQECLSSYMNNFLQMENLYHDNIQYYINPTGRFVIAGPESDVGLTGRKIIVDTYGGFAPHGGGAFSGKDPSKVDRSAAYMARYCAKNIVASKIAKKCLIQVSYSIGIAKPVSLYVTTMGTSKISDSQLTNMLQQLVNFEPRAIIERLELLNTSYLATSTYGHFGRRYEDNKSFTWENTDLISDILSFI